MLCPECNHSLLAINLRTRTGSVALDYCNFCGGVWTDYGEVNFLSDADMEPLAQVLPQNPQHPSSSSHFCPKDRNILQFFKAESIPAYLDSLRCPACNGMFFPNKNLLQIKKAQKAKIDYFKSWNIPLQTVYAIVIPVFLFVVLGVSLFATIFSLNQGQDVRSRAADEISKPIVLHPSDDTVVISFTTQSQMKSSIKYWILPDTTTDLIISETPQTNHSIIIENLAPGINYNFQLTVESNQKLTSPVYMFAAKKK